MEVLFRTRQTPWFAPVLSVCRTVSLLMLPGWCDCHRGCSSFGFSVPPVPVQPVWCEQPLTGGTECSERQRGSQGSFLGSSFWSARKTKPDWWSVGVDFWMQMLYSPFGFSQTCQRGTDLWGINCSWSSLSSVLGGISLATASLWTSLKNHRNIGIYIATNTNVFSKT